MTFVPEELRNYNEPNPLNRNQTYPPSSMTTNGRQFIPKAAPSLTPTSYLNEMMNDMASNATPMSNYPNPTSIMMMIIFTSGNGNRIKYI